MGGFWMDEKKMVIEGEVRWSEGDAVHYGGLEVRRGNADSWEEGGLHSGGVHPGRRGRGVEALVRTRHPRQAQDHRGAGRRLIDEALLSPSGRRRWAAYRGLAAR